MKRVALIPAYNAGKTIEKVIRRIPEGAVDEVIVLNDGSRDDTLSVLRRISNIAVLSHEKNRGYGSAQVTLYQAALEREADHIVILHSDGGHDPEEIPKMLAPLREGYDVVVGSRTRGIRMHAEPLLGSRFLGAAFNGPMPAYKFLGNVGLTFLINTAFGTGYYSFHSGYRACRGELLEKIPFEQFARNYLFDMEFLLECHRHGVSIKEVPVGTCYDKDAGSSASSIKYGLGVLRFVLSRRIRWPDR